MNEISDSGPLPLASFGTDFTAVVVGASGGIGAALADELERCAAVSRVYRLARRPTGDGLRLDVTDEASIADAARAIKEASGALHLVLVATGMLHGPSVAPEKTWRSLDAAAMEQVYRVNTVGPAMVAKHFLPLLARQRKAVFAPISARVGSISDNQLGGWHSYRASKAALNMVLKTLSIELAVKNPGAVCVGLHPGTVDTGLSEPFQRGVAEGKLFTPTKSARHLLTVLDRLGPEETGHSFAWDGQRIPF